MENWSEFSPNIQRNCDIEIWWKNQSIFNNTRTSLQRQRFIKNLHQISMSMPRRDWSKLTVNILPRSEIMVMIMVVPKLDIGDIGHWDIRCCNIEIGQKSR